MLSVDVGVLWLLSVCESLASSFRLSSFCPPPDLEMPEHDLEPPRFSRRALERILNDWMAVKAMIFSGQKQPSTR